MTFLIFRLSPKIILELKEKWSVFFFTFILWLKNILVTFFSQSRMILRNSRIPENLELDKRTKENFIYFIRPVVQCQVFSSLKCLEKCFHAAKPKNKGKHAHQIEILLLFSNSFSCLDSSAYTAKSSAPRLVPFSVMTPMKKWPHPNLCTVLG